ncbi:hypothetical protein RZS08_25575, partial [Arthrospira platensis SPKY1]|nr:hypothetical protein [Arthrospira platensis SPKY1]
ALMMDPREQARRESLNLMVHPFYTDDALHSFRHWLTQVSDSEGQEPRNEYTERMHSVDDE